MQNRDDAPDKGRLRLRRMVAAAVALIGVPGLIALGVAVWDDRKFYIVSLLIILLSMIPFALMFERRKPSPRELVVLAVMVAIAVAARAAFYMLPQFKPIAAIVIICGAAFGCESGFIVGAMSAFLSNFIFGQGPYTPFQMEALGLVGLISGLLFYRKDGRQPNVWLFSVYGFFAAGVVYGFIVDASAVLTGVQQINWEQIKATYAAGVVFNLIHAAATFLFLLLLTKPMLNKLNRVRVKYGLLE